MRVSQQRSSDGSRQWSIETADMVDRAVALVVIVLALGIAQLFGIPTDITRAMSGAF